MKKFTLLVVCFASVSISQSFASQSPTSSNACNEVSSRVVSAVGEHVTDDVEPTFQGKDSNGNDCTFLVTMSDAQFTGEIDFSLNDAKTGAVYSFFGNNVDMSNCQSDLQSTSASTVVPAPRNETVTMAMKNLPSAGLIGATITITNGGSTYFCKF